MLPDDAMDLAASQYSISSPAGLMTKYNCIIVL